MIGMYRLFPSLLFCILEKEKNVISLASFPDSTPQLFIAPLLYTVR